MYKEHKVMLIQGHKFGYGWERRKDVIIKSFNLFIIWLDINLIFILLILSHTHFTTLKCI